MSVICAGVFRSAFAAAKWRSEGTSGGSDVAILVAILVAGGLLGFLGAVRLRLKLRAPSFKR